MRLHHVYFFLAIAFMATLFFSCRKDVSSLKASENTEAITDQPASVNLAASLPGRTLAANCFQCHGTNGYATELKIAGMSYSELVEELNEFRAKDPKASIMNFHAQSYTSEEINLIADFFSKQP